MIEENLYKAPQSDLAYEKDSQEIVYAGFWIRLGASFIDSVISALITLPLLHLIYGKDFWLSESFIYGAWDFIISYILPAVAIVLFWIFKSATPGKMMLGLKVISLGETQKLTVSQSIIRYLGYFLSAIGLMIGFIWVAFDKRKQGWHDKLSNTSVIKK